MPLSDLVGILAQYRGASACQSANGAGDCESLLAGSVWQGIVHAQLPLGWRRQPFLVPDVLYEGRWEF
jgi:hypothetical protein